ncbi:Uncharacterized protein HZ326_28259 [Fusarium oxysporum f. sp. albedinis]|nr:Uncharacterized protein HZ326_28259 [Fusarium oxysporum f. sp. albedinis]
MITSDRRLFIRFRRPMPSPYYDKSHALHRSKGPLHFELARAIVSVLAFRNVSHLMLDSPCPTLENNTIIEGTNNGIPDQLTTFTNYTRACTIRPLYV